MILGIALWKSDIGPRLGFPEVSGLPGQSGKAQLEKPQDGAGREQGRGVRERVGRVQVLGRNFISISESESLTPFF